MDILYSVGGVSGKIKNNNLVFTNMAILYPHSGHAHV